MNIKPDVRDTRRSSSKAKKQKYTGEIIECHLSPQFRDDNKKLHPCLVDFLSLPEPERNYNLQMSGETLK